MKKIVIGFLLMCLTAGNAWADTKLSALTELSAVPATTDEFYINDGGTSKKITYANMAIPFISSDVGDNKTNISTNTTNIATNVVNISIISGDIGAYTGPLAIVSDDVGTNTTNIATNVTNIATNTTGVAIISADIGAYTGPLVIVSDDVATNIANIATNVTNIATNVTNIGIISADIGGSSKILIISADVGDNKTNIATNVTNIATNVVGISILSADMVDSDMIRILTADVGTLKSTQTILSSDVGDNKTNIATNTTSIATNVVNISILSADMVDSDMIRILTADVGTLKSTQVSISNDVGLISGTVVNISADIAVSKQYIIASARFVEMWDLDKSNGIPMFTNNTPWTLTIQNISADSVSDDTQVTLRRTHWSDYSLSHDIISVDISADGVGSTAIGTQIYYVGIDGDKIAGVNTLSPDSVILADFNSDDSPGEPDYVGITIRMSR